MEYDNDVLRALYYAYASSFSYSNKKELDRLTPADFPRAEELGLISEMRSEGARPTRLGKLVLQLLGYIDE